MTTCIAGRDDNEDDGDNNGDICLETIDEIFAESITMIGRR